MVGSSLVEVCERIIFGLTRSVAEHYNPNDNESNPELFSLNPRERTGFEWNIDSDEEFIFQEYGEKQVRRSAGLMLLTHNPLDKQVTRPELLWEKG